MKFILQRLGVDVSKDTLDVALVALSASNRSCKIKGTRKFKNNLSGFKALVCWLGKKAVDDCQLQVAMEATGVYHENLAHYLNDLGLRVAIVLPNKVKAYGQSLNQTSKTDQIDAKLIARLAVERSLDDWVPANKSMLALRGLTRERQRLTRNRTACQNQLHALNHSHLPARKTIRRLKAQIKLLNQQIVAIQADIKQLRKKDPELDDQLRRLQTVPQIGLITAATVLAETGGFVLFESREQLIKYAGLDIVQRQSGSSINGKTRISKKGNSRLRACLYMPSVGVSRSQTPFARVYQRVLEKTLISAKALVAAQRKLLTVMFAIHKTGQDYELTHHQTDRNEIGEPEGSPTVTHLAEAEGSLAQM